MLRPAQGSFRRVGLLLLALAMLVLATASVAGAAAPRDSKLRIVFGKSMGEISLGQSVFAARSAWGGGRCRRTGPFDNFSNNTFSPYAQGECRFDVRRRGYAHFKTEDEYDDEAGQYLPALVSEVGVVAWWLGNSYRQSRSGVTEIPRFAFVAPYASFRTTRGIRLGSTFRSLLLAHPKVWRMRDPDDGIPVYKYRVYGQRTGGTRTTFDVANGRVVGIQIERVPPPA